MTKATLLVLSLGVFVACGDDDDKVNGKGATTDFMKGIAANVGYIQSVEKDSLYTYCDGIQILDTRFTYCRKPTRMLVAIVDLTKNVTLSTCSPDNLNTQTKMQRLDVQAAKAEAAGKKVLLAINGDYYSWNTAKPNETQSIFYKDGVAVKDNLSRADFNSLVSVEKDGNVRIAWADEFQLYKKNVTSAIGGWHRLVTDGIGVTNFNLEKDPGSVAHVMDYHPRTFVGLSQDRKTFYMFIVDGRQAKYSNGMRYDDMVKLCKGAGCYQAFNLDGGGSTTFVVRDEKNGQVSFPIINSPSDNPPRAVANGLMVIAK